jgi:hypothetical protein
MSRALESTARHADTRTVFPARPDAGFNFPYILRSPSATGTPAFPYLLVETNNTGRVSPRLEDHLGAALKLSGNGLGGSVAKALHAPLLMPVFPRADEALYTHSLGRDVLLTTIPQLRRLDLQLLAMIGDAQARLAAHGARVHRRVLLTGFSASAMFATRFAALHPRAVQALAAGGLNGFVILPTAELAGHRLEFPLGIADLAQITGEPFDAPAWKRLPQFLFMGAQDTNDAVQYDDAYPAEQRALVYDLVGRRMTPDRWAQCARIYADASSDARFKTYDKLGHGTNGIVHAEVADFLRAASDGGLPT